MPQPQPPATTDTDDRPALLALEHAKTLHVYGYKPRDCRQCWPGGPPPESPPSEQPHTAATEPASDGLPFGGDPHSLGAALARVRAKLALSRGYELGDPDPDPEPTCRLCGDSGFVRADVEFGHPDFGKAIPCRCHRPSLMRRRTSEMLDRARVPQFFQRFRLDEFPISETSRESYDAVCAWWERLRTGQLPRDSLSLLLWSPDTGIGKTSLACSIMHAWAVEQANRYSVGGQPGHLWVDGGGDPAPGAIHPLGSICAECGLARDAHPEEGRYIPESDLLDELRATFNDGATTTARDILDELGNVPFLIVDDLGTASPTLFVGEKLLQLINRRHDARRPTIFTSNCSLDQLEQNYGALAAGRDRGGLDNRSPEARRAAVANAELRGKRLLWRIIEMSTVIEFVGDNLRDPSVRDRLGLHGSSGTLPLPVDAPRRPASVLPMRSRLAHPDDDREEPIEL